VSLTIAWLFGLTLVVYLIVHSGADDVTHGMLLVGWGVLPITQFHLVPLFFSALSWRDLLYNHFSLTLKPAVASRIEQIARTNPNGGYGVNRYRFDTYHIDPDTTPRPPAGQLGKAKFYENHAALRNAPKGH